MTKKVDTKKVQAKIEASQPLMTKRFWLAVFLCVAGVGMLFTGMFVGEVVGVISASVISGGGLCFITAAGFLGIDLAIKNQLVEIIKTLDDDDEEDRKNGK